MNQSTVNMLWVGNALGRIELLSIASWLAHGHRIRLHSYESLTGIPDGVEVVDGERTVPRAQLMHLRHRKSGSYALGANYFRYRLQQNGAGLWSDLDVVCLKPIQIAGDCVFGLEDDETINNAVLYLKQGLPVIDELTGLFKDNYIPPWTRPSRARKPRLKRFLGLRFSPGELPWGTYGPQALTHLARKHGLFGLAQARHVFYPLSHKQAQLAFDPAFSLDSVLKENTLTLHLWNEALRELRHAQPPAGSPLSRLYAQFGI